ncbi:MAG TPA: DUF3309 family protein [Planctomycetaceae bacterium]|nr:DUF3309 family protein [Planctomycetaceae bacterium]
MSIRHKNSTRLVNKRFLTPFVTPRSRRWGYGPTGGLGLVVVILLILVLMGRI